MAAEDPRDTPEPVINYIKVAANRDHGRSEHEGLELAHATLWEAYDRGTRVQAWMLQQASN